MRIIHALIVIALCALTGCTSSPQPTEAPDVMTLTGDRVELPTAFFKGRPFVALKVNGQGPYWFLVDTGADSMLLSPLVVREARIPKSRFTAETTGSVGTEKLTLVNVDRVEADSLSLRGVGAGVLSADVSRSTEADHNFGGVLGMGPLKNLLLEIDYPQHQVSVARIGSRELPATEALPYEGSAPFVVIATPSRVHPTIIALLDTGSEEGFAFTDIADYPARVGLVKSDQYTVGIGGLWRARFGQLAGDIRLGPATWRDPRIQEASFNRIGSAALGPWKLVINPTEKKLWLLNGKLTSTTKWTGPLDPDGRPAVYGYVSVRDGDIFVVKEVDPGSRAERAGLTVGDHCRLEQQTAFPTGQIAQAPSSGVRLHVTRGSEDFIIAMSLASPP